MPHRNKSKNTRAYISHKAAPSSPDRNRPISPLVLTLCIIGGIITSLSFSVRFVIADYDVAAQLSNSSAPLSVAFTKLLQNLDGYSFADASVAVLCSFFYFHTATRIKKVFRPSFAVTSAVFAFINIVCLSMSYLKSWDFVFGNKYQFILSLVCMVGYGLFFNAIIMWMFHFLDSMPLYTSHSISSKNTIVHLWEKHTALFSFTLILLCWLPWLVFFYPGSVTWDAAFQLEQVFGVATINSHHPLFSTGLIGAFVWIGHALGNDNLGVFFYVMFQTLICAFIYAQVVSYTKKLGCPRVVQILSLAFYSLFLEFGAFIQNVIKDTLFSGLFTLFILMTVKIIMEPRVSLHSWKNIALYSFVSLLVCLMRNNGFPVVLTTILVLLLFMRFSKLKNCLKLSCGALFVVVIYLSFSPTVLQLLNGYAGSKSEALSIPFQQTARYVRDFDSDVTEDEKSAIRAVLDYDVLADIYNPEISDPVKNTYRHPDQASKKKYIQVWFHMFLKHPGVYIQATLENSYGYFAFTPPTLYCNNLMDDMQEEFIKQSGLDIHFVFSSPSRDFFQNLIDITKSVPLLGQLYSPALYTWLMILSSLYLFVRKKRKLLLVMVPVLLLFLTCVASPVNGMWRYYMPIVSAAPAVLAAVIAVASKSQSENTDAPIESGER